MAGAVVGLSDAYEFCFDYRRNLRGMFNRRRYRLLAPLVGLSAYRDAGAAKQRAG